MCFWSCHCCNESCPPVPCSGVGPSGPQPSARVEEIKRRRLTLMCVFLYLDTKTLSQLSLVCKEWKVVSRHPALWRRVRLRNARIGSKVLSTLCHSFPSTARIA